MMDAKKVGKIFVTTEMAEMACQAFFVGPVRKPWPWRETQDMDEPEMVLESMRAALSAAMGILEASPNDDAEKEEPSLPSLRHEDFHHAP